MVFLLLVCLFLRSVALTQSIKDTLPILEIPPGPGYEDLPVQPHNVRPFSFITETPGNISKIASWPFQKKNLKPLICVGLGTTALVLLDQPIVDGVGAAFRKLGIQQKEKFHPLIKIGDKMLLKRPGNINSFFYQLGEPAPTFLAAGGFYLFGKINKDERASRTASEITESFVTSFVIVQTLKRVCGRQSPNKATRPGGEWNFFPSLSDYNSDPTSYFAFPSGHMAALMSLTTVIAENYPEKKWIRPVGYSITGLTALSQLNNKVHWASDFLVGLCIGYLSGKFTHQVREKRIKKKVMIATPY